MPMRVPPDYVPKPGEPSPIGVESHLDCFEDELFDNDEPMFCSDTLSDPNETSHAKPNSDSFANPNPTLASNSHKAVDIDDWVESDCQHLDSSKRQELAQVLSKCPSLWDNKLGTCPDSKVHLDLKDDVMSHSSRGCPVPCAYRKLFKEELDRLVSIGVLEPCGRSEWCAGSCGSSTILLWKQQEWSEFAFNDRILNLTIGILR